MKSSIERNLEYKEAFQYKLLSQLPIIAKSEIRSLSRITKSFSADQLILWQNLLSNLLIETSSDLQFCVFGYFSDDSFIFILRPDLFSSPQIELQEMVSLISSTITAKFYSILSQPKYSSLPINSLIIFKTFINSCPSLLEVFNLLVSEQNISFRKKISFILRSLLEPSLGKRAAFEAVKQKKFSEKLECLKELSYNFSDNSIYLHGIAAYKTPILIDENIKKKWFLDLNLPLFMEQKDFILHILSKGHDIFRADLLK